METKIEIRTGSDSDMPKISRAYKFLESLDIPFSSRILSAHRTPAEMMYAAKQLEEQGYSVSIAAAGGSAHLPGMTASETLVPVVGLPVKTTSLAGIDSLYSIIQMPEGIPVGSVGIGQDESAAILAAQIAYVDDTSVRNSIREKRGLEGRLPSFLEITNSVGIIKPVGFDFDNEKYAPFINFLESLGLTHEEYTLSCVDAKAARGVLEELELKGVGAIIAMGYVKDDKSTNHFPGHIAKHTDVPTIGLPLAEGCVIRNAYINGDIFHDMLAENGDECDPIGYPLAGMGINRATNAALYAAQIIGLTNPDVQEKVRSYRASLSESVKRKRELLEKIGVNEYLKTMDA